MLAFRRALRCALCDTYGSWTDREPIRELEKHRGHLPSACLRGEAIPGRSRSAFRLDAQAARLRFPGFTFASPIRRPYGLICLAPLKPLREAACAAPYLGLASRWDYPFRHTQVNAKPLGGFPHV